MRQRSLFLTLVCVLAGCQAMTGFSNSYPDRWPQPIHEESSACPDISGAYLDRGQCKYLGFCDSIGLYHRLTGLEETAIDENTYVPDASVTIRKISNDQFDLIRRYKGKTFTKSLKASAGDFTCNDGALWVSQGQASYGDGTGYVSRKYTMGFTRTENGALVAQHRNSGWGLVLWAVPIGGTQIFWYKWDKAPH